jgi:hypothetical protein
MQIFFKFSPEERSYSSLKVSKGSFLKTFHARLPTIMTARERMTKAFRLSYNTPVLTMAVII